MAMILFRNVRGSRTWLKALPVWLAVAAFLATPRSIADSPAQTQGPVAPARLASSSSASITLRVLDVESEIASVTEMMRSNLRRFLADARSAIVPLQRPSPGVWNRRYAESVLKTIDATLIRHGFLYPATGAVDLVTHALTEFQMSADQRPGFETQSHNQRRRPLLAERFPGPFFVLDCDTACFVYLAVAEELNLPLRLVLVPSHNRRAGHAFIRWREGRHYLNWETNDGRVLTDDDYVRIWGVQRGEVRAGAALTDLTPDQILACAHHRIAIRYERHNDFHAALRHLVIARHSFPQNLDVRRQLAWLAATTAGQTVRSAAETVDDATYVVGLTDDSDARDTLAAALAAAGRFDEAVRQEKAAIRSSANAREARLGYQSRLRLYQLGQPYHPSRTGSTP
jgi:hypothetical protein